MLEATDRPIAPVINILALNGVEAGYLVPTPTGLEKSILDAHAGLKDYLRIVAFHDYQTQAQGDAGKRIVKGFFVTPDGFESTQVSLYRPETKNGDSRLWIYGLKSKVKSQNLLAIFAHENALYIVNVSDRAMLSNEGEIHPTVNSLIQKISGASDAIALELLNRLRSVASHGWITSLRAGPTGVGFTLEEMLNIRANSSRAPDYKGIELKAGRSIGGKSLSRTTLFSKPPDWTRSRVSNGMDLLDS